MKTTAETERIKVHVPAKSGKVVITESGTFRVDSNKLARSPEFHSIVRKISKIAVSKIDK